MDTEQCIADHQNHSKYLAINVESFRASLGKKKKKTVTQTFTNSTFFFFLFAYSLSNRIFALKGSHGIMEEM